MNNHEIIYGKKRIKFTIEYKNRKSLEIIVLPDKSVIAITPHNITFDEIKKKIVKRGNWILKQQEHFNQFIPQEKERKYVSGETHRYLGKQYLLKIIESHINQIKLNGKNIIISSKNKNNVDRIKKLLNEWYKAQAKLIFEAIIDSSIEKLKKYSITKPEIQIKKMKSRWGSCDFKKKRIVLNTDLIKAPSYGIEYVIMHELCHLKYPMHDNEFYFFLSIVMPDWKQRKERLEKAFL